MEFLAVWSLKWSYQVFFLPGRKEVFPSSYEAHTLLPLLRCRTVTIAPKLLCLLCTSHKHPLVSNNDLVVAIPILNTISSRHSNSSSNSRRSYNLLISSWSTACSNSNNNNNSKHRVRNISLLARSSNKVHSISLVDRFQAVR